MTLISLDKANYKPVECTIEITFDFIFIIRRGQTALKHERQETFGLDF